MLHELQAEIMDVIWSRKLERTSVNDVLVVLQKRREIAYTTVMTTIVRLHEKGLLERHRDGKRYLYTARLSREEYVRESALETMTQLRVSPQAQALALLAQSVSAADERELDELEQMIRQRRKELGK